MLDEQPVKPKVTYAVHVSGLPLPLTVICDDIREEGGYIRYYDGDVPVAIVPVGQLIAAAVRGPVSAAVHTPEPDEPDEPNERVRAAARRLPEIVERKA